MKTFAFGFAVTLFSIGLSGCASEVTEETSDTDADSVESELTSGASNYGYFQVLRQDYRKCSSPMCGGVFVKRVNQAKTLCADGKLAEECYVGNVQLTGLGLTEDQQSDFRAKLYAGEAIVKARTYKNTTMGGKTFSGIGQLKASEGWLGATGSKPQGTFYRAANNGIKCIKAPCPSMTISPLNSPASESSLVTRVDLKSTDNKASSDALAEASTELVTSAGILIAGNHLLPKCMPTATNCGPLAIATEFYLPVRNRIGQACGGMLIGGSQLATPTCARVFLRSQSWCRRR